MRAFAAKSRFVPRLAPLKGAHGFARTPAVRSLLRAERPQAKLQVGAVNDPAELEAERVAATVMRMPDTKLSMAPAAARLSRKCEACAKEEDWQLQTKPIEGPFAAAREAPGIVREVLRSPGQPLDPSTRAFFEPRFGRDLSFVRIHTDAQAAASAHSVRSNAYTVGCHVVFGAGRYGPDGNGRHLLAHELAHVVQQSGGGSNCAHLLSSAKRSTLQRQCVAAPCPVASLPISASPYYVWKPAELCLQDQYKETHEGNTVSRNWEWTTLTGKTPPEMQALSCLKKSGFTAKSGMEAGEPDLWDFTNQTMYEITSPNGVAFRTGKLAAEIKLANDITSTMECGGSIYHPGTWDPPGPCYAMGPELLMSVQNVGGILVYRTLKPASKELVPIVAPEQRRATEEQKKTLRERLPGVPVWIWDAIGLGAAALIITCFASGICEIGAIIATVGEGAAWIIAAGMRLAGVRLLAQAEGPPPMGNRGPSSSNRIA
jgi:hypothetical protein